MIETHRIPERSGTAFELRRGETLVVIDPMGVQVADLLAFNAADLDEVISSGRSLDYAEKIYLTTGDTLYSNRSNPQLEIVEDSVGRHDFLLTPGSVDTFRHFYPDERSEQPTSELQSLMRISYAVFCLKKKTTNNKKRPSKYHTLII